MNKLINLKNKLKKIRKEPSIMFYFLAKKNFFNWVPDKIYLKMLYRIITKRKLDLINPLTYNEKLQWLKLYDRNPLYTQLADKFEVRKFIAGKIGEEYLIPLLGVWNSFDEIDFNHLPNQFVLKCTHDSGSVIICKDKNTINLKDVRKQLNHCLKRNYYYLGREWPYKYIKPRLVAEEYMVDESGVDLKDYKIFCFNGEPKIIEVDFDRFKEHKTNIYDTNWNYLHVQLKYPSHPEIIISRPKELNKMLALAEKLSNGIPHVRVDFYTFGNSIYFGEMTFYDASGFETILPEEFSIKMGSWIK